MFTWTRTELNISLGLRLHGLWIRILDLDFFVQIDLNHKQETVGQCVCLHHILGHRIMSTEHIVSNVHASRKGSESCLIKKIKTGSGGFCYYNAGGYVQTESPNVDLTYCLPVPHFEKKKQAARPWSRLITCHFLFRPWIPVFYSSGADMVISGLHVLLILFQKTQQQPILEDNTQCSSLSLRNVKTDAAGWTTAVPSVTRGRLLFGMV